MHGVSYLTILLKHHPSFTLPIPVSLPPFPSLSSDPFTHLPNPNYASNLLHIPIIIQPLIRLQIKNPPISHLDPLRPDENAMTRLTLKIPLPIQRAVVAALGFVEGDADPGDLRLWWFRCGLRVEVGVGRRVLGLGKGGEGPNVEDCAAARCVLFGGARGLGGGWWGWLEDAAFVEGDAWLMVVRGWVRSEEVYSWRFLCYVFCS